MGNYAGIDWAAEKHDVRVCDEAGEEVRREAPCCIPGAAGMNSKEGSWVQ
ncbi:MAG: hypothetical protein ACLP0J_11580 [Solirubrobacteraceae bacterium]|jgi:hypothetical protein